MTDDTKAALEAGMQAYSDARDNLDRPAMTAAAEQYREAVMRRIEQERGE